MLENLPAASELVLMLNNSYNESYALVSTEDAQHGTCSAATKCLASDRPAYEESGNDVREPANPGFMLCCVLVTLILFMALVDLLLIAFTVLLTILLLLKKFFGVATENENNNENDNDPLPVLQALPFPPPEDSRSPKGDQLTNRRSRRHRRSGRSDQTSTPSHSPPSTTPSAADSLPSAAPVEAPVPAFVAGTRDTASTDATQLAPSAALDTKQDSSAESSDDRLRRGTGSEFEGIGELDPCNVRFVGSQLRKLRRGSKVSQQTDSDSSERKRGEDNDVANFFRVTDPASAQHHADSDDSSWAPRPQQETHHSLKSAKKRPEFPVFADPLCEARFDKKVEQQASSNDKGSLRNKVSEIMTPNWLCDVGGNSPVIREVKDFCYGSEHQPGESEQEVQRSGNCNEATNVDEAPIPSKHGSTPHDTNWERRTPVGQKKREYGMFMSGTNCEALLAIDALLEEEENTVEVEPDGKDPAALQPRDLQLLPNELQVIGRRV